MQILELTARIGLPIAFFALPLAILAISRALQKRKVRNQHRANRAQRIFL